MTGDVHCPWIIALYFAACKSCGLAIFSLILPDFLGVGCMDQRVNLDSSALPGRAKTALLFPPGLCEPLTRCGWFAPAAVLSALSILKFAR